MSIKILTAGSLTTLQDQGRFGFQESGFSPSGAADPHALRLLNILLANEPYEAAMEITLNGIRILFESACVFALSGADNHPSLNGTPLCMQKAYTAEAGDILECGTTSSGIRTYLGVHGGFAVPEVMGSRSTGLKFGLGGFEGRKLKAFDHIPLRKHVSQLPDMEQRQLTPEPIPSDLVLRVVMGPQDHMFEKAMQQKFLQQTYTVTPQMDRMGIRFDGEPIPAVNGSDIVSDAIVTGAIQITNEGRPILLMQDRQTTGGYAKIACVISADLGKAGQLRPGTPVRFQAVPVWYAQYLARKEEKRYRKMDRIINKKG